MYKKSITFNNKYKKMIAILSILFIIFLLYNILFRNNEIFALSKYGSTGNEVIQIQTKLKRWGYYTGNIDGIYGSQTLAAVKFFQKKNGLSADRSCRNTNIARNGNIYIKY